MGVKFNADEIFAMAEQIERNGAKFYRHAADLFADKPEVKELFTTLAVMEDDHEKTFAEMRSQLSDALAMVTVHDPHGESDVYLEAMAGGHVFSVSEDPTAVLKELKTVKDVLKNAISRERDSVVFYSGMKGFVPEQLGRDKIDPIILEELNHIAILSKKLVTEGN
jgi:rubrerythrin